MVNNDGMLPVLIHSYIQHYSNKKMMKTLQAKLAEENIALSTR